jgi:hypothetical protein
MAFMYGEAAYKRRMERERRYEEEDGLVPPQTDTSLVPITPTRRMQRTSAMRATLQTIGSTDIEHEAAISARIRTSRRVVIEEIEGTKNALGLNVDKKGIFGFNGGNERIKIRRYIFED